MGEREAFRVHGGCGENVGPAKAGRAAGRGGENTRENYRTNNDHQNNDHRNIDHQNNNDHQNNIHAYTQTDAQRHTEAHTEG